MIRKFHPVQAILRQIDAASTSAVPSKSLTNSNISIPGCGKRIPSLLSVCVSIICWALTPLLFFACSAGNGWSPEEKAIINEATPPMRVLTVEDAADSLFLRQQCKDFTPEMLASPEYASLARLMVATVTDPSEDGVGIAGPQVGISRRVVAVQRFDKPGEPFEVYPNVRIVATRGDLCSSPEGCLSVPGLRGDVMRWRDIDITYTLVGASADGQSNAALAPRDTTERVQGFTAVIFQHECDHLDGVLYIDKVIPGSLQERD